MQMKDKVGDRLLEALRCFPEGKKAEWDTEISAEEWMELFRMDGTVPHGGAASGSSYGI